MVFLHTDLGAGGCAFTLRPNCSLSWRHMKLALCLLLASLAAVAAYFATKGAWLVFPFTGLEMLMLAAGVYLSARRGASREVVHIDDTAVVIHRGRNRIRETSRFSRHWTGVGLIQDPGHWYPSRLLIGSHGHSVEIGRDLTETERVQLADDLQQILRAQPTFQPGMSAECTRDLANTARQRI